jgi:hypothetical protein
MFASSIFMMLSGPPRHAAAQSTSAPALGSDDTSEITIEVAPHSTYKFFVEKGRCEDTVFDENKNEFKVSACLRSATADQVRVSISIERKSDASYSRQSSTITLRRGARAEFGGDGSPQKPRIAVTVAK